MAFDGITVSGIAHELADKLTNGRIFKIAQPESDELYLTIKINKEQYRLVISANASMPLMYLSSRNKTSPLTAPSFCMLLRKYINNGRITRIYQPGFERIINIDIEHLNELGDMCKKTLIVELMGKHSNIIFVDETNKILDSIKHISVRTSSVREVLPGRDYFIPNTANKLNPLEVNFEQFQSELLSKSAPLSKSIYTSFTGISPVVSENIIALSSLDSEVAPSDLGSDELYHLFHTFEYFMEPIKSGKYHPVIYYNSNKEPKDYSALPLDIYSDFTSTYYDSISEVLEKYYAERDAIARMKQRSSDLRMIVHSTLSKYHKKYDLQLKQLKDTEKRDKYKVYGELLTTYGYSLTENDKELKCINYYDNQEITIPVDNTLSPIDNAKKYFDKYSKLKRTYEALSTITLETKAEIEHLESVNTALNIASCEDDLKEIKEELINYGYIRRKGNEKKAKFKSKPIHIKIDDNYEIYIGKNNYQNEEVSFKIATGNDWWFHTKKIPGSHIIVKSNTDSSELPDEIYEIAGSLAAYYSKGRESEKVEIDYTQKKHLKRVAGAAPGFVIYHTNYSMISEPKSIEQLHLKEL